MNSGVCACWFSQTDYLNDVSWILSDTQEDSGEFMDLLITALFNQLNFSGDFVGQIKLPAVMSKRLSENWGGDASCMRYVS